MEALLTSFVLVSVAEIGDKTQLLSFLLAARYRGRASSIIAGIFVATIANHLAAAAAGDWIPTHMAADTLRWVLGVSFLAFAAWALSPDRLEEKNMKSPSRGGAFAATVMLFFLAEMGDKTQLATVALGAQYANLWMVAVGTTLGMMAANVPAVLLGESLLARFPLARIRQVAAGVFALCALLILAGIDLGAVAGQVVHEFRGH